jgi:hypothetical protein
MSDTRKDLPPVNSPNFLEKVREALSIYMGNRGDKLDRGVTLRDLTESGMVVMNPAYRTGSGGVSPIGGAGAEAGGAYEPNLTPPPIPAGFTATAAISNLLVECSPQTYTQGHGHAKSVLYGAIWVSGALPVFSDAVVLTEFSGTVTSHATNPSTTWHLWLKWVTVDGVYSTSPAGGTNGVVTRTGEDVALLLTALNGELTESQLFSSLGERIDLIDGASGLAGSVNARVLAEATARGTAIQSEATARSSADGALATRVDTVVATATTDRGNATSAIQSEATARANADEAEASARTTLASTVDGNTSAIQTEATTRATQTGDLYAQYTVKVDTNGYVSGYGLANVVRNGTPTSEFIIRADNFAIAPVSTDNTAADGSPFFYRTVATTINGVSVPAGAYMKAAFIHDATITNAKIADLAVDNAKIADLSVSKLTTGSIAVGTYAQSTSYIAGSAGWRINGNGAAEFSDVVVRGTVYASAGQIGGNTIDSNAIRAGQTSFNVGQGFYLGSNGTMSIGNSGGNRLTWDGTNLNVVGGGTFSGALSAATGSFSGALSAASGTFAGSLQAATGTFGDLTVAANGNIKSGQYAYNSGTGFWLGAVGGTPKFSLGNPSGAHLRWDGVDLFINTPSFDVFSASVPSGDLTVEVPEGTYSYGSRTASVSGGKAPYKYSWFYATFTPRSLLYVTGAGTPTVTMGGTGDGNGNGARITCVITDANGRTTTTSFSLSASHASSSN